MNSHDASSEVIELGLLTKDGGTLRLMALVVPFMRHPLTSQPICYSKECYNHLLGLDLADSADINNMLEIDVLIRSHLYWDLGAR